jgi:hypothetical protein
MRPTAEHDVAAGAPEWLITETGDDSHITVYKMTNVLSSSATFTTTQLAVNSYTPVNHPLNPDFSVVTDRTNSGIQKVAEANNTLAAAQTVGVSTTEDDVRPFSINSR